MKTVQLSRPSKDKSPTSVSGKNNYCRNNKAQALHISVAKTSVSCTFHIYSYQIGDCITQATSDLPEDSLYTAYLSHSNLRHVCVCVSEIYRPCQLDTGGCKQLLIIQSWKPVTNSRIILYSISSRSSTQDSFWFSFWCSFSSNELLVLVFPILNVLFEKL